MRVAMIAQGTDNGLKTPTSGYLLSMLRGYRVQALEAKSLELDVSAVKDQYFCDLIHDEFWRRIVHRAVSIFSCYCSKSFVCQHVQMLVESPQRT